MEQESSSQAQSSDGRGSLTSSTSSASASSSVSESPPAPPPKDSNDFCQRIREVALNKKEQSKHYIIASDSNFPATTTFLPADQEGQRSEDPLPTNIQDKINCWNFSCTQ